MTSFETLLARADEETLGQLVGGPTVRLLRMLDPRLARAGVLRQVVTELHDPSSLLRDPDARERLLMLMRADEAAELASALQLPTAPASAPDAYRHLASLEVRAGSASERRLRELLGVVAEPAAGSGSEAVDDTLLVQPSYALFTHQRDAATRANAALGQNPRRVLVHMPTGSGKTRVAMHVIAEHLRQHDPALVVWLAYSEELCGQAVQEFQRAWSALGNRGVPLHRFWGAHSADIGDARDGVIVAGLAKMYGVARRSVRQLASLADHTTMVVLDEAHVATAETYSLVLGVLANKRPDTQMMGLTATPGRTWSDIDADEELAALFDRRKVTLRVEGYDNPIEYLVDEGYLSNARFRSLFYDGSYTPSAQDLARVARALDIPSRILELLALDEQRNLVIVREIEQLARTHSRILLFAATVEHARLIATVLRARGLSAAFVTGETPPLERSRTINRFLANDDEPQVLCNFGVLTTGFDAPAVSAAVIARPTTSLVLYSQMVGRAIRGPRMGGTEECEIVTVVDRDLPGFGDVAESFMNWEDIWEESR